MSPIPEASSRMTERGLQAAIAAEKPHAQSRYEANGPRVGELLRIDPALRGLRSEQESQQAHVAREEVRPVRCRAQCRSPGGGGAGTGVAGDS